MKKDPNFKAVHLSRYLKANAILGTESLERFPKEEIRALRERLLALAQSEEAAEKVYQCNFHMFPITR